MKRARSVEVVLEQGEYYVSVDGGEREAVDKEDGRKLAGILGIRVSWEDLAENCGAFEWDNDDGGTYRPPPFEVGWQMETLAGDNWIPSSRIFTDQDAARGFKRGCDLARPGHARRLVEVSRRVCPEKDYAAAHRENPSSEPD